MNRVNSNIVIWLSILLFSIAMVVYYKVNNYSLWDITYESTGDSEEESILNAMTETINTDSKNESKSVRLLEGTPIKTLIRAPKSGNSAIGVRTVTWNETFEEDNVLVLEVRDDQDSIVGECKARIVDVPNNGIYVFVFEDLFLEQDRWYTLLFTCNVRDDQPKFALMENSDIRSEKVHYAEDDTVTLNLILYQK